MSSVLRRVGRYDIVREIGYGGMATVYLARQTDLDRDVALKELSSFHARDAALAARFFRESRIAGSLSHPNVVSVIDFFQHDGIPFIAMEYIPRGSLRPMIGRLSLAQAAGVLEGVLAALSAAAAKGVVHRDLKPENLLVTNEGGIKVADFGIAKAADAAMAGRYVTTTGTAVGTPAYMAPEQAMAGDVGPWTDLYSTGVIAYELLAGRVPFVDTGNAMAVLMRHVHEPPPPARSLAPELDPALEAWLGRLLEKAPEDRPASPVDAWDEFEDIIIGTLGPRWRRKARLVETTPFRPTFGQRRGTESTPAPLTPAPFDTAVSDAPGADTDITTDPSARDRPTPWRTLGWPAGSATEAARSPEPAPTVDVPRAGAPAAPAEATTPAAARPAAPAADPAATRPGPTPAGPAATRPAAASAPTAADSAHEPTMAAAGPLAATEVRSRTAAGARRRRRRGVLAAIALIPVVGAATGLAVLVDRREGTPSAASERDPAASTPATAGGTAATAEAAATTAAGATDAPTTTTDTSGPSGSDPPPDPPTPARGLVAVATAGASAYLADPAGRVVDLAGRSIVNPAVPRAVAVLEDTLVVADRATVTGLQRRTLRPRWAHALAGTSALAVQGDHVVAATADGGKGRVCSVSATGVGDCARLPFAPSGLGVDEGRVWVTDRRGGTVVPVAGGKSGTPVKVGPEPRGPVVSFAGRLFVPISRGIAVVDLGTRAPERTIALPTSPTSIHVTPGTGRMFAALPNQGEVAVFDARTLDDPRLVPAGVRRPVSVTGSRGRVLVTGVGGANYAYLDPTSGTAVGPRRSVAGAPARSTPLILDAIDVVRRGLTDVVTLRLSGGRLPRAGVVERDTRIVDGRAAVEIWQSGIRSRVPAGSSDGLGVRVRRAPGRLVVTLTAARDAFRSLAVASSERALVLRATRRPPPRPVEQSRADPAPTPSESATPSAQPQPRPRTQSPPPPASDDCSVTQTCE